MSDDIIKDEEDDEVKDQPPVEPTKKMVEVPLEFVQQATEIMKIVQQQQQDIKRLEAAADKSQLANYDMRNGQEIVRKVLVNTFDGKLITSWKMTKDIVVRDAQGRWYEDQEIMIVVEDGEGGQESKKMPYNPDFVHGRKQIPADIVSMFSTPEGANMVRISLEGRTIDLDVRFVN